MRGPGSRVGEGILTPAVAASALFVVLAGVIAVTFIGARGGLQLPVAPTPSLQLAAASAGPSAPPPTAPPPVATPVPSALPAQSPTAAPTVAPTAPPTVPPSAGPTGPIDPLAALPGCPGHPGCYAYTVRTGDSFTGINDRFGLLLWITDALNPEVADKGVITVGQTLYLGRDPEARLDPCPDAAACRLYTTRSGDTLSRIAGRYGLTVAGIEALNPSVDPNAFGPGTLLRLPLYLR